MKIVINHNNTVELIPESEEEWVTAITALRGDNLLVSGMGRSIALDDDLFSRVYRLEKMIYGKDVGPGPGGTDNEADNMICKRIYALAGVIEQLDNEYVRAKTLFLRNCNTRHEHPELPAGTRIVDSPPRKFWLLRWMGL